MCLNPFGIHSASGEPSRSVGKTGLEPLLAKLSPIRSKAAKNVDHDATETLFACSHYPGQGRCDFHMKYCGEDM